MTSSQSQSKISSFFDPLHPLAGSGKRTILTFSFLFGIIAFYIAHYSGGSEILATVRQISPLVILIMLLVQTIYIALQAKLLQGTYAALGFRRPFSYLFLLFLGLNLINTIAPLLGISGFLYVMYLEKSTGIERSKTLLIGFWYYAIYYLVFLGVLLLGLMYLLQTGQITSSVLVTAFVFIFLLLFFLLSGIILFTHPTALLRTIQFIGRLLHRLWPKRDILSDSRMEQITQQSKKAWQQSRGGVVHLLRSLLPSLGLHACSLTLLWLAFRSIAAHATLPVLTTGYTVGTLLNIVSITPGGIGFAEGGMTAAFLALDVPIEQSLVATLIYRAIFICFPLIAGVFAIHLLPKVARKHSA